jgi:hypothetical protein
MKKLWMIAIGATQYRLDKHSSPIRAALDWTTELYLSAYTTVRRFNTWSIVLFTLVLLFGCKKTELDEESCATTVCTTEVQTVGVTIHDSLGNPVTIDKLEVIANGTKYDVTQPKMGSLDYFVIADDSYLNQVGRNRKIVVTSRLFINGVVVRTDEYEFKTDCCHIMRVSGPDVLVVP